MGDDVREFDWWPEGARWPWLPAERFKARILPEELVGQVADRLMEPTFRIEVVGEVRRERIGIGPWLRHRGRAALRRLRRGDRDD